MEIYHDGRGMGVQNCAQPPVPFGESFPAGKVSPLPHFANHFHGGGNHGGGGNYGFDLSPFWT